MPNLQSIGNSSLVPQYDTWLRALSLHVSSLDRRFGKLVDALLQFDFRLIQGLTADYTDFFLNLSTAHPLYALPYLEVLIKNLRYREGFDEYSSVLDAIVSLVEAIPTLSNRLMGLLINHFPHHRRDLVHLECYTRNLLKVSEAVPLLRNEIFDLIVKKLLVIDVEVQIEFEDIREDELEDHLMQLSTAEASDDEGGNGSVFEHKNSTMSLVKIALSKLDRLLAIFLHHLQRLHSLNSKSLFGTLLNAFERNILPTFKCKFTQFIVFYIASLNPSYSDLFLGLVASKLTLESEAPVTRLISASYIGSFVARAQYLDISLVVSCSELLSSWCISYISDCRKTADKDGILYASVQALLYIFCFRHSSLLTLYFSPSNMKWKQRFEQIIYSPSNPLKACSPSISEEFARIMTKYELLFCYSLIERNKRSSLVEPLKASLWSDLECFFPFDPIDSRFLPQTKEYVNEAVYLEWTDKQDDDDSDDVRMWERIEEEKNTPKRPTLACAETPSVDRTNYLLLQFSQQQQQRNMYPIPIC
jgi:RNA polymerase I-specific transcription initiation factor RRN3